MKTVNLQLSKQLKEAGYGQSEAFTSYYWVKIEDLEGYFLRHRKDIGVILDKIASPTADEILEKLPIVIDYKDNYFPKEDEARRYWLKITKNRDSYEVMYLWEDLGEFMAKREYLKVLKELVGREASLADAAAKCWLFLKKEELI